MRKAKRVELDEHLEMEYEDRFMVNENAMDDFDFEDDEDGSENECW